jgi:hypothetical protein
VPALSWLAVSEQLYVVVVAVLDATVEEEQIVVGPAYWKVTVPRGLPSFVWPVTTAVRVWVSAL